MLTDSERAVLAELDEMERLSAPNGYSHHLREMMVAHRVGFFSLARRAAKADAAHADAVRLRWHPASERPNFYDGDGYLVAVALHEDSGGGFEIHTVTIACDEDYFEVRDANGEMWCWDWDDVTHWMKLDGLRAALRPAEQGGA